MITVPDMLSCRYILKNKEGGCQNWKNISREKKFRKSVSNNAMNLTYTGGNAE